MVPTAGERDMLDRGDKWDESQGCGTRAIISLDSLRKRFVKSEIPQIISLLFRPYPFSFYLPDNDIEVSSRKYSQNFLLFSFLFGILF